MPHSIQGLNDVIASGWELDEDRLVRDFVFASFGEAMGFMVELTPEIAAADHHPEWTNVYATVTVELTTHDAGGVTQRDLDMARFIDEAAAAMGGE